MTDGKNHSSRKKQDIETLSRLLTERGIFHRKTDLVLEIKLY